MIGMGGNHIGIGQFCYNLLQGQEISVFLFQNKVADLCLG